MYDDLVPCCIHTACFHDKRVSRSRRGKERKGKERTNNSTPRAAASAVATRQIHPKTLDIPASRITTFASIVHIHNIYSRFDVSMYQVLVYRHRSTKDYCSHFRSGRAVAQCQLSLFGARSKMN
jgi:hypothetical protein